MHESEFSGQAAHDMPGGTHPPVPGSSPLFTIFIPTYNRAGMLPAALASVADQTYRDFEVIVVDDGSEDATPEVVAEWQGRAGFPIRYLRQSNQGKHMAHNAAVAQARGQLFITLDSDDSLLPEALARLKAHWDAIPAAEKPRFAGVAGLCLNDDGSISGDPYPEPVIDSDYLEIFTRCRMNGERREAIRVDVLKEFPYPRFEGERYIRPTLILRRMAHRYRLRFTNEVLQVNRHADDGISAKRFIYRMRNPQGLRLFYQEAVTLNDRYMTPAKRREHHVRYVRYSLHCGVGLGRQWHEVKHRGVWLFAVPLGLLSWLSDSIRKRIRGLA